MSTDKKELYRDSSRGKIAGVCAGLSDYFGMELWLVRIIAISAALLTNTLFFLVVAYIAGWFILDNKPKHKASNYAQTNSERPVKVKTKVWQSGEPPRRALQDLKEKLSGLDSRIQNVEKYVTSSEFTLSREIDKL